MTRRLQIMDKYNTLLAAIHALDPFDEKFFRHPETEGCFACEDYELKHNPECPVTHLRNMLNAQYAPVDIAFLDDHIKSPTDNGV